jgi:uncharacterized protein
MSDVDQMTLREESVLEPEGPARGSAGVVAPVAPGERILSVDVLRGAALLGILIVNINSFGLPFAAAHDPSAYGAVSAANLSVWLTNHVLFEGKLRAIFSMLFGASVIIMTSRAEKRGAGVEVADIYYRRTLWLAAIGVIHGYLIWFGDILFHYGVVGLALFPMRKLSGRTLCIIGGLILAIHSAQGLRAAYRATHVSRKIEAYQGILSAGGRLSEEQRAELERAEKMREGYRPDARTMEREIQATRSGYLVNLAFRAPTTASWESDFFYRRLIWDVAGMLILGMGLMKLGVFDGSRSFSFYGWMAIIGYGIGLPLDLTMAVLWLRSHFDPVQMFWYMKMPSDIVRFSVAAGHIAVIMMICKAGVLRPVTKSLSNVGRMALSNYLLTSVLCTLFFYGYGLGMFARLQRYQLLYVLAAVWVINLVFSAAWLRFFRFGPAEWVWRSLTYGEIQPMLVRRDETVPWHRGVDKRHVAL